jgi:hypothetical protein
VCNGAVHLTQRGIFRPGDILIFTVPVIRVVGTLPPEPGMAPEGPGPDGIVCTDDDVPLFAPVQAPSLLTSGTISVRLFDQNNRRNNPTVHNAVIAPGSKTPGCSGVSTGCASGERCYSTTTGVNPCPAGDACVCRIPCGGAFCLAEHAGAPVSSCDALRAGRVGGAVIGGGFSALDFALGDAVVTFHFNLAEAP